MAAMLSAAPGSNLLTILKMAATLSAAPGRNILTILKMAATLSAATIVFSFNLVCKWSYYQLPSKHALK